jgi:glycosyltransferase involved in cell wall biosynthesis
LGSETELNPSDGREYVTDVAGALDAAPLLSVVVPVFNEHSTIAEVIRRVQAVPFAKELVVVDDDSTDGTRALLKELELSAGSAERLGIRTSEIRFLFQERNRGKGAALRRGFAEANGEIIIVQDADLELDPADYPSLIAPILEGRADVVYGSRFLQSANRPAAMRYTLANRILTLSSNVLTGLRLTDVWIGYKVFRRSVLEGLTLKEDRFGFEPEFTAKIARNKWRVTEIPVSYQSRSVEEGKKIRLKDGINGMWATVRYSLFE